MKIYTKTGHCRAWGSRRNARRVAGLTRAEREMIRSGKRIYMAGCPEYKGTTDRVIVAIGERFYTRMPRA